MFEAADIATDPAISRLLVALFNLMQGKEFAGQERAAGAAAFAAGGTGTQSELDLLHLIELQETCFERFEAFCPPGLRSTWDAAREAMPLAELERLRRKLLAAGQGKTLPATLAEPWFACCSARLDHLRAIEDLLAGGLRAACATRIDELQCGPDDPDDLVRALAGQAGGATGVAELQFDAREPFGPRLTRSIVDVLHAQSCRLQAMSEELAAVRASLDERKLIDRAKGVLMRHHGLSEDAAYRLMRQTAMDQGRRLPDVARAVIELEPFLPGVS